MLRLERLSVRYPHTGEPCIRELSLEVGPGELILLVGPTGCGKSTLLSAISGVIPHFVPAELRGTIEVDGLTPAEVEIPRLARRVAHLFQNVETQLFTERVEDEVMLPLELGPEEIDEGLEELAAKELRLFGLEDRRRDRVSILSAGYKQRVALASMHLSRRRVLLLDEPLAYLDRRSTTDLLATLQRLRDRGLTIIAAEHREELIRPIADRIIRLGPSEAQELDVVGPGQARDRGHLVLEARDLTHRWADDAVLRDVSFRVHVGECVVVVGANGSGKTTLCGILAGVVKPTAGHVSFRGQALRKLRARERVRAVSFVLQNPERQLFASTVSEEVDGEMLRTLGLAELASCHPRTLSFGQKRRLALARVLQRRPAVLIVDELSVGQDSASLRILIAILSKHLEQGGGLVVTTHDHRVVDLLADRLVVTEGGRLIER